MPSLPPRTSPDRAIETGVSDTRSRLSTKTPWKFPLPSEMTSAAVIVTPSPEAFSVTAWIPCPETAVTVPAARISIFPAPEFVAWMPVPVWLLIVWPVADWLKSMPPAPDLASENAVPDVSTLEPAGSVTTRAALPDALRVCSRPITAPLQVKIPLPCDDSKHPFRKRTSFLPASRGITV